MSFILKRIIIPLVIILILAVGSVVYILFFKKPIEKPLLPPEGKTMEEKIESVTVPERETPLSQKEWQEEKQRIEKLLESITAPKK